MVLLEMIWIQFYFYLLNYLVLSYYIRRDRKWYAFSLIFLLLYVFELLLAATLITLLGFSEISFIQILSQSIGWIFLLIIVFVYVSSGLVRYMLYDRMRKIEKDK